MTACSPYRSFWPTVAKDATTNDKTPTKVDVSNSALFERKDRMDSGCDFLF